MKLRYHSFLHATLPVLVIELEPAGGEREARFQMRPERALLERIIMRKEAIAPEEISRQWLR